MLGLGGPEGSRPAAAAVVAGGLPLLPGATRLSLLQLPGCGEPVLQPFDYSPWGNGQTLGSMLGLAGGDDDAVAARTASPPAAGAGGRGSSGATGPQTTRNKQQQQLGDSREQQRRLLVKQEEVLNLHGAASKVVKGLGEVLEARCYSRLHAATADGLPVLGYHPEYEAGRVVVAVAAAGEEVWGPGASATAGAWQLSPMVAKLAGDLLLGLVNAPAAGDDDGSGMSLEEEKARGAAAAAAGSPGAEASRGATQQQQKEVAAGKQQQKGSSSSRAASGGQEVVQALGLGRKAIGLRLQGLPKGVDPWDGLQILQRPAGLTYEQLEQQQDEAEDARRWQKGDAV